MMFNSTVFASFFAVFFLLYVMLRHRLHAQNLLLLAASYVFYGWWDYRFLSLILVSTLVDYACGRLVERASNRSARLWVTISVLVNLGILACFKYCDFFLESTAAVLSSLGISTEPRLLNIVLPVGISFYTFQTMSYTIDVFRGKLPAHRSLLEFAVFVAFFPQLVAGPICRASQLLPQIARRRSIDAEQASTGCYWFLWGLFKKVVIADQLAMLADPVFTNPEYYHGGAILVAVYAFTFQIYCDFSGYTDMARGVAATLGFDLPPNFNLPYLARNPSEFWQRWHMTLSTWLRDYLYVPLGGNRKGLTRTCINLMLTMMLGGLWHGAAWTFVIWGAFHGLLLIAYRLCTRTSQTAEAGRSEAEGSAAGQNTRTKRPLSSFLSVFGFFHLTCVGWLIFRAPSFDALSKMLAGLATGWPWWMLTGANSLQGTGFFVLAAAVTPLLIMAWIQYRGRTCNAVLQQAPFWRGAAYACMFLGIVMFGDVDDKPFIYFQF